MKIHFSIIVLILLFFALSRESVNACQCRIDPEETNTERKFTEAVAKQVFYSDFVFSGKFSAIDNEHVKFKIERIWKGNAKPGNDVIFNYYNNLSHNDKNLSQNEEKEYFISSCAYDFQIDKSYLVYANTTLDGFIVSKCGRTNTLEKATRDIEELNRQSVKVTSKMLELPSASGVKTLLP